MNTIFITKSTFLKNYRKVSSKSYFGDEELAFVCNGYFYECYYSDSFCEYVYTRRKCRFL